jgi:hypothetical protein
MTPFNRMPSVSPWQIRHRCRLCFPRWYCILAVLLNAAGAMLRCSMILLVAISVTITLFYFVYCKNLDSFMLRSYIYILQDYNTYHSSLFTLPLLEDFRELLMVTISSSACSNWTIDSDLQCAPLEKFYRSLCTPWRYRSRTRTITVIFATWLWKHRPLLTHWPPCSLRYITKIAESKLVWLRDMWLKITKTILNVWLSRQCLNV